MRVFKFLDAAGRAPFTGFTWPAPGVWVAAANARTCQDGVHACRSFDLSHWLAASLWEVELAGDIVASHHKVVASRGRLVRMIDGYPQAVRVLAELGAWRARDRAVAISRAADGPATADRFEAAVTLDDLAAVGTDLTDDTFDGRAGLLADDAAHFAMHGEHPQSPFVATCSAGHAAAGLAGDQGRYDEGSAAERAFQSAWLAERLSL
ncbi:MAG: hypothetical protein ACR2HQ_09125 [Ilumatobacteraceae bacterium]